MLHTVRALPFGLRLAGIVAVLVVAFSGTALAGVLPSPIQDSLSETAALMGVTLPSSDSGDILDPDSDNQSGIEDEAPDSEMSSKPTDNHGAEVSAVATDKTAVDESGSHGGAVSAVASNKSNSIQNRGSESSISASNGYGPEDDDSEGEGAAAFKNSNSGQGLGAQMSASAPGKSK